MCARFQDNEIAKVEGHVFQPLMEYVRERSGKQWGITLDECWTARSCCTPDLEQEIKRMEKTLQKIPGRTKVRMGKAGKNRDIGLVGWDSGGVEKSWRNFMRSRLGSPTTEVVVELKMHTEGLVCAPMDKNTSDMVLM